LPGITDAALEVWFIPAVGLSLTVSVIHHLFDLSSKFRLRRGRCKSAEP